MATPHHWPPELSKLVAQAVARLNKGKRNVLAFFAACSVPDEYLDPWRQRLNNDQTSVSKLGMAENIVMRINEKPEANQFIKVRREVIRRIVETNSYDQCWPDDQAVARGLVASIRELVEERDFFSKTIEATERLQEERRRHRAKELDVELTRKGEREQLRKRFDATCTGTANSRRAATPQTHSGGQTPTVAGKSSWTTSSMANSIGLLWRLHE